MRTKLTGIMKLYEEYDNSLRKRLKMADTEDEVNEISEKYLKKLDRSTSGIKAGAILLAAAAELYGIFRGEINEATGMNLPYIPNTDKAAHFGKGLAVSMAIGRLHDFYVRYIDKPKPSDADDIMKKRKKGNTLASRAVFEGVGTMGSAIGWEIAQEKGVIPSSTGFSWGDAFADMAGHAYNVFVDAIYYTPKLFITCNAVLDRKEELGIYEDREELSYKDAPRCNIHAREKLKRKLRVLKE